jgi:hypothetical protein
MCNKKGIKISQYGCCNHQEGANKVFFLPRKYIFTEYFYRYRNKAFHICTMWQKNHGFRNIANQGYLYLTFSIYLLYNRILFCQLSVYLGKVSDRLLSVCRIFEYSQTFQRKARFCPEFPDTVPCRGSLVRLLKKIFKTMFRFHIDVL